MDKKTPHSKSYPAGKCYGGPIEKIHLENLHVRWEATNSRPLWKCKLFSWCWDSNLLEYDFVQTSPWTTMKTKAGKRMRKVRTYLQIHMVSYPDIWTLYQHRCENLKSPTHIQVAEAGLERVPHWEFAFHKRLKIPQLDKQLCSYELLRKFSADLCRFFLLSE